MKAAFAQALITPRLPCLKAGWLKRIVARRVRDHLYLKVAIFESGCERIAFVVLDTLSIRWTQVAQIRRTIVEEFRFPWDRVMISATHNHAGPAVTHEGDVPRDEAWLDFMVGITVATFGQALRKLKAARIAFGRSIETSIADNRRVVYRDGLVRTHGSLLHPDALYIEGPVDPVVAVTAVRATSGKRLGLLVNYALHPTHHGGDDVISANWPGAMARNLRGKGWPVVLFLQGASGNITTVRQLGGQEPSLEAVGKTLAAAVIRALKGIRYTGRTTVGAQEETVSLPFRKPTKEEIKGTVRGAQRFIDSRIYDRSIPRLLKKIRARRGRQLAQVQALRVGDHVFVGIPAELFVELGLKIKEQAHPWKVHVVSLANGIVGYVPTKEAFRRGGYETTFIPGAMLAPEAGDLLVEAALRAIHGAEQVRAQAATGTA